MSMKNYTPWIVLPLGLAATVGCTVPFLVNSRDGNGTTPPVISNPSDASSSLPIFLPQPGSSGGALPSPSSPFGTIDTPNPTISGPLPGATATPFLPNITPNIGNQIIPNAIPTISISGPLGSGGGGGAGGGQPGYLPIVKSIIKGRVMGYNIRNEAFEPIANAQVRVSETLSLSTDQNGIYQTSQEFDQMVSISAAKDGYIASTVTGVPPGTNRDIHLNPLNNGPLYRQETFDFSDTVTNLNENGRDVTITFADGFESRTAAASPDKFTGRYNMSVRLKANRSTTQGTLFASVFERVGNLTQLTQYGYSPNVAVPTPPPQPVPTATPVTTGSTTFRPLKPTQLLVSFNHLLTPEAFGQITVSLAAQSGSKLRGCVAHVYMNLPDGGRVLVAKYNDSTSASINQPLRVPRVANTSFTIEARSGSALRGSDIIVPNIQIGNTVVRTFLEPPEFTQVGTETNISDVNKTHFVTGDTTPTFGWSRLPDANSYQMDVQGETPESFRWEAYTLDNSLTYPDFGSNAPGSIILGNNYRAQLMASDFDIGTFNVLSFQDTWEMPVRLRNAMAAATPAGFSVQLLNPSVRSFSQGYRISYSTVTFLAN
jgi:hypothetical protein